MSVGLTIIVLMFVFFFVSGVTSRRGKNAKIFNVEVGFW